MATISLRDYFSDINSLIESGHANEAIFHCVSILNIYPKCVEVYRLLGQALLESDRLSESLEVFSQLLSVLPDDFTAHAALSEINSKNHQLDKAIWHLERAFELQPSSAFIQDELRKLYTARDGVPPAKIRLTRGALIRMYAKGELYQQAISEALSLLESDIERQDIKVLLAKMYSLADHKLEAVEICSDILSQSPYCFEANLIMHEIEQSKGVNGTDSLYWARLKEIDPYFAFVNPQQPSPQNVPSDAILLEKPQYNSLETEEEIPEWARNFGITWSADIEDSHAAEASIAETKSPAAEVFTEYPDALDDESSALPTIEATHSEEPEAEKDDLPDWISQAGWVRAIDESTSLDSISSPAIDSFNEGVAPASPADELPDWLKNFSAEQETEIHSETANHLPDFLDSDLTEISALTTDEIDRMLEEVTDTGLEKEQANLEISDLLPPAQNGESPLIHSQSSPASEPSDLPDWLKDLETSEPLPYDDLSTSPQWMPDKDDTFLEDQSLAEEPTRPSDGSNAFTFDSFSDLSPSEPELTNEPHTSDERSLEELADELKQPNVDPDAHPPELETPPAQIEEHPVESDVPSWVKKILSSAEPIASTSLAKANEAEKEIAEDDSPLITELPEEIPEKGAISEEVNLELMSWLEDINPDDALEETSKAEVAQQNSAVTPSLAAHDISFESLADPSQPTSTALESEPAVLEEADQVPALNDNDALDIHDRLSSLLDADILPSASEISSVAPISPEETDASVTASVSSSDDGTFIEKEVLRLLDENKFQEIEDLLSEIPAPADLWQLMYDKAETLSQEGLGSFQLWKTIGDIGLKEANLAQAIDAYQKAESYLFHH